MRVGARVVALSTAGLLVVIGATAAGAAPLGQAGRAKPDAAVVKGYRQVSAGFTDAAQTNSSGYVECPTGTVVVGGGVEIAGTGLNENVNGTFPTATTDKGKITSYWLAYVSNSSTTAGTFTVFADCAKKPAKWTLVTGSPVNESHGQQVTAGAGCPSGLVVLGGGGVNDTGDTDQNLNSTSPYQNTAGWYVNSSDADPAFDTDARAFAICAKAPSGYALVNGNAAGIGSDDQEGGGVSCPSGTVVLSGGAVSSSAAVTVDVNSTFPATNSVWQAYEDDTGQDSSTVSADAICAKA